MKDKPAYNYSTLLHRLYGADIQDKERAVQLAHAVWGEWDNALCPLEDGVVVWQLWQEGWPHGAYGLAYRALYPQGDDAWTAAMTAAQLGVAYDAMVADGLVPSGKQINVCCADYPTWVGCILAQRMGVPIYTVVGADNEKGMLRTAMTATVHTDEGKVLDNTVLSPWQKHLPDVLVGVADRQDTMDALAIAWEEQGYLMHPETARAYSVACDYRREAENRHIMVVAAPFHPYDAPETVHEAVLEYPAATDDKAIETLQLQTGLLPCPVPTQGQAHQQLTEYIATHNGD